MSLNLRGPSQAALSATYAAHREVPIVGPEGHRVLTVIVYHAISSLATFQTDCDYYQEWNYTTVDPDAVQAWFDGTGTLPEKPLLITFDDGLASQYQAFQELNARGMVGTMYVATGWIDGTVTQAQGGFAEATALTWTQLQQIKAWGHRVQSHTVTHSNLADGSAQAHADAYTASKARIEQMVPGETVNHLAYPYGGFTEAGKAALKAAGCKTARTVKCNQDNTFPGANLGQFTYTTLANDKLSFPCAGSGASDVFQGNYMRRITRDPELIPDYGFKAGGKGWSLAAGASIDTDVPAGQGFTKSLKMPQQASSVQSVPIKPIPVGAFAALKISVWIKTNGMGSVYGRLNLLLQKSDAVTTYTSLGPVPGVQQTGTNGWTQYTATVYGDHNSQWIMPQLYVQTSGTPTGTVWFTGFSIRRVVGASPLPGY